MLKVKYATLCLLITYHWHGSWAVSAWPSVRRPGIAAEVNGSPTDARLNIPVVKRSSNQADLANELPLPLPRRLPVVIAGDSPEKLVESLAVGLFEPTQREYANRTMKKSGIPMIRIVESVKMMIERTCDHSYGTESSERNAKRENTTGTVRMREEAKKIRGSEVGIESLILGKDAVSSDQTIGGWKPPNVMAPRIFPEGPWFDDERALVLNSRKNEKFDDESRSDNSEGGDVEANEGTAMNGSATHGTVSIDIRGTRDEDTTLLTRGKRHASLSNIRRIDSAWLKARKRRENDERTSMAHDTSRLPDGSSLSSTVKSSDRVNPHEDRNDKPSVASSGIASSIDVAKLLVDSSRLHQQSRNTKPRTIVQHLRGYVNRRTRSHGNSPISSRNKKFYDTGMKQAERRHSGKIIFTDRRDRRRSKNQRISKFDRSNGNSNRLRFIPFYKYYGKNPKFFGSKSSRDNTIKEIATLSERGELLTPRNIANLPSLDQRQIENLSKSLGGVFDRHLSAKRRDELPNVRAVLPKRVFVATPRVIYATKILPAPFPFGMYFPNSGKIIHDNDVANDVDEKHQESPVDGIFDGGEMEANLKERPTIPAREDTEESVTSAENFVTPLPPRTGQVSLGVNQPDVPKASTFPNEIYRFGKPVEMENSSTVGEYEKIRDDENEPRMNDKSTIEHSAKDHYGSVGSSYDNNSASTYASNDEIGTGNVDHSSVIVANNDEYTNSQNTRHSDLSNIELGVTQRTAQMTGRQRDGNYDRGSNKWRGEDDENDRTRYFAKYSFGYIVNDHDTQNDFGHHEMRDEGITKGRYHVRLPDGRTQKVNYQVDDDGYHAIVSYIRDDAQ